MKKIISIILAMSVVFASFGVVSAEDSVTISPDVQKNTTTITVTTNISSDITLRVYELTKSGDDYVIAPGTLPLHIDQMRKPSSVGDVNTFKFPAFNIYSNATSGKLRAVVNNKYTEDFIYTKTSEKIKIYQQIESATFDKIEKILSDGVDNCQIIFDMGGYFGYDTKIKTPMNKALADYAFPVLADDATDAQVKAFEDAFKPELARLLQGAKLLTADASNLDAIIKETKKTFGIDEKYYDHTHKGETAVAMGITAADIASKLKSNVVALDFSNAGICNAFNSAILLSMAGKVDNGSLSAALEHFNGKGITLDKTYSAGFDDTQKNTVSQYINNNVSQTTTISDIESMYFTYSKELAGDGSGGGSGGGTTPPAYIPPAPTDPKEETGKIDGLADLDEASWAKEAIEYLVEKGVLAGRGDGKFYPNDTVTREELVKIIIEAFGLTSENTTASFDDVSEDRWSYNYIATAFEKGIINGTSESEFSPADEMTRENMAVIIYRLAKALGLELKADNEADFDDFDDVAVYAKEAVKALASAGVINGTGDGLFSPKGIVTRAQAAKIVYELIKIAGGVK